jgi:hypothetical protein
MHLVGGRLLVDPPDPCVKKPGLGKPCRAVVALVNLGPVQVPPGAPALAGKGKL